MIVVLVSVIVLIVVISVIIVVTIAVQKKKEICPETKPLFGSCQNNRVLGFDFGDYAPIKTVPHRLVVKFTMTEC